MGKRSEQTPYQRNIQKAKKNMKRCFTSHVTRELQWEWDTTTHLLGGQNPKHWQHQMLVRMWSNSNSHSLLVGRQNAIATFEGSLEVSYKTKHILIIQPNNCTPWVFVQMNWKFMSTQYLCIDVYSSFIYNCQNLEAIKKLFSRWMDN